MKKNPGRADRRRMAKKNRTLTGRMRMKLDNWKKHFESYSRKIGRAHRAWVKEQATYHLYGSKRWQRLIPLRDVKEYPEFGDEKNPKKNFKPVFNDPLSGDYPN